MDFFVSETIFDGRPESNENRLEKEIAVYDFLDSLKINYGRVDHDAADTIDACEAVEKVIGVGVCKNLFLCNRQKTDFYLLMMDGHKPFKTSVISKEIGNSRLSFGDAESMEQLLNVTPGSVSIMGLMNDKNNRVRLLIDKDIYSSEYIRCHPCINTSTLKIKTQDILRIFLPRVNHNFTVVNI